VPVKKEEAKKAAPPAKK